MTKNKCTCNKSKMLIFPCSGGLNVGKIANEETRDLMPFGRGKMYCLAGSDGKDSCIVASTKAAERINVIDGCPVHCARKTLEHAGFTADLHMAVTDFDIKKKNSFFMDVSENDAVIDKRSGDENED